MGVDIGRIRKMQGKINSALLQTANKYTPNFVAGHYAGFFEVNNTKFTVHTDGVGTKILVAQQMNKHDTIGIDAVAMNANDLICVGSRPIVGVDYIALSRTDEELVEQIMNGIVSGCKQSKIALVGGETAILADMIKSDKPSKHADYDLAMTVVGINEAEPILGKDVEENDVLIGLESSGLHSNGFSLARKVLDSKDWAEQMLIPTKIYVDVIMEIISNVKINAIAHITGGAFSKLSRIGEHAKCGFLLDNMPEPEGIFAQLQKQINNKKELYRTFNMGVGMVLAVSKDNEENVLSICKKNKISASVIGKAISQNSVILQTKDEKINLT